MRFAIIDWVKVNQWKLSEFLGAYFEYCLRFPYFVSASVQQDVGLVVQSREFLLVVSLQFDGIVVVPSPGVKPGGRVNAGVGEVLVGFLTQQPQEGELDRPKRIVADAEATSEC